MPEKTRGAMLPFVSLSWGIAFPLISFSFIFKCGFLSVQFPLSAVLPAVQVRIGAPFIVWVSAVGISETKRF